MRRGVYWRDYGCPFAEIASSPLTGCHRVTISKTRNLRPRWPLPCRKVLNVSPSRTRRAGSTCAYIGRFYLLSSSAGEIPGQIIRWTLGEMTHGVQRTMGGPQLNGSLVPTVHWRRPTWKCEHVNRGIKLM